MKDNLLALQKAIFHAVLPCASYYRRKVSHTVRDKTS